MNENELTKQLVLRAQAGDREAFGQLIDRHSRLVISIAIGITGDQETAYDLSQDTFIKAYKSLGKLQDSAKFKSWLCSIASNTSKNWLRSKGQKPSEIRLDETHNKADELNQESTDTSQTLEEITAHLPEDQRQAVIMKYQGNLSYAEISEALGVPISTVRGLLARAVEKLRKQFNKE